MIIVQVRVSASKTAIVVIQVMKAVERLEFQASLVIRGKESREELPSSGMIEKFQCRRELAS